MIIRNILKKVFIGLTLIFLTHCGAFKNKPNIEWIQNMMQQPSVKPQEEVGKIGPMKPPEGTQALGKEGYPYKDDLEGALKNLKNPYQRKYNQDILLLGKRNYQKACIYCHGITGEGNGSMKTLMIVKPPSLLSEKVTKMPDAHIYHIIHEGQGVMGSHRLQVRTPKERWALIFYIRNLQKMPQ